MTQETQKLIHVICLTTRFAKIAVSSIARFPARPKERKTMKTICIAMFTCWASGGGPVRLSVSRWVDQSNAKNSNLPNGGGRRARMSGILGKGRYRQSGPRSELAPDELEVPA